MLEVENIQSPFRYEVRLPDTANLTPVREQTDIVNDLAEKYDYAQVVFDAVSRTVFIDYVAKETRGVGCIPGIARAQKNAVMENAIYKLVCLCEALSATPTIKLVNGRILECSPISSIKPKCDCDKDDLWNLFADNVNLFLQNADRILGDSRLFLTPVSRKKNCFFSSIATLGEFIEFWIYCKENGIESNGYPICDICGNPMTGSHGCRAVTHNGERVKATLNISFINLIKLFGSINSRYIGIKSVCKSYTLAEAVNHLKIASKS